MYTHTIAIARCLLSEGRLLDVDRMISPLLPATREASSTDEELLLRCMLAQARLFSGTPPQDVLALFAAESDAKATEPVKHFESALATLSVGLALALPNSEGQDLHRALHLFQITQKSLQYLQRSDYLHWAHLGQAVVLYELGEYREAGLQLEKATAYLKVIKDDVAERWLAYLRTIFSTRQPIVYKNLVSLEKKDVATDRQEAGQHVYVSEPTHKLLDKCQLIAGRKTPVLLLGEPGSGKETTARLIHELQFGQNGSFEFIDCAAITEIEGDDEALDSVLRSDSDTIFLNHVEHLSKVHQELLFTFIKHLDETEPGTRIISASSAKLSKLVSAGKFDADLYHRLKICTLEIPPLRMRKQDIPVLTLHFARTLRPEGVEHVAITENALSAFLNYDWPGNIRQLKNEIERILVHIGVEPWPTIDFKSLSQAIRKKRQQTMAFVPDQDNTEYPLEEILSDTERTVIERALGKYKGQVSSAAKALGLTRQGLYKKLKRLGIRHSH